MEYTYREPRFLNSKELKKLGITTDKYLGYVVVEITTKIIASYPAYVGLFSPECIFPECGHTNTGTPKHPASYHHDCYYCGEYYCGACNYEQHQCYGCGDWLSHRTEKYHYEVEHAQD